MNTGMTGIRYFSYMNNWIDYIVLVLDSDVERAKETIRKAMDMYWDEEFECYGDAVECMLYANKIPYCIQYIPWDHENDCEFEWIDWEKYLEHLSNDCTIVHIHS